MVQQHQQELKKQLWNIANSLRGNMSADDFRDYILGLIFYKYLSDKLNTYANQLLSEDGIVSVTAVVVPTNTDGVSRVASLVEEANPDSFVVIE